MIKTIAEFAIRRWLQQNSIGIDYMILEMVEPHMAVIKDTNGDQLKLIYNPSTRMVIPMGLACEDV